MRSNRKACCSMAISFSLTPEAKADTAGVRRLRAAHILEIAHRAMQLQLVSVSRHK
jgi:hypothetical protein